MHITISRTGNIRDINYMYQQIDRAHKKFSEILQGYNERAFNHRTNKKIHKDFDDFMSKVKIGKYLTGNLLTNVSDTNGGLVKDNDSNKEV